jgi:FkbM family methyltransferase
MALATELTQNASVDEQIIQGLFSGVQHLKRADALYKDRLLGQNKSVDEQLIQGLLSEIQHLKIADTLYNDRLLRTKTVGGCERCPFNDKCGHNCLGTKYGGRYIPPEATPFVESLDAQTAVVWGFGIGGDISWDITMICRFGFTVHAFDPSPSVPDHVKMVKSLLGTGTSKANLWNQEAHAVCPGCETYWEDTAHTMADSEKLVYHAYGYSPQDGNLTFYTYRTRGGTHGSWSLDPKMRPPGSPHMDMPVRSLSSLMTLLQTTRIDILKVDVEGFEHLFIEELMQVLRDSLPRLIFIDIDSMGACFGIPADCKAKKKVGAAVIAALESKGYSKWNTGIDYTFFK